MSSETAGAVELIKTLAGWITGVIGFVTALVSFAKLLRGQGKLVTKVLLVSGVLVLWFSFFYLYWAATGRRSFADYVHVHAGIWLVGPEWARRFALAGIVGVPAVVAAGVLVWRRYRRRPRHEIIVAVADFEHRGAGSYRVTRMFVEQLSRATREYPEVRIERLSKFIPWDQGSPAAIDAGRRRNAAVVLWGDYDKTKARAVITVHFELLSKPKRLSLHQDFKTANVDVMELERFTVQEILSQEMSYLTLLVLGFVRFEARDWDGAIARLTDALNQRSVPEEIVDAFALHLTRGSAYLQIGAWERAEQDYSRVLQSKPDHARAYLGRAVARMNAGDLDGALTDVNESLRVDPESSDAYTIRSFVYGRRGELEQAIADTNELIRRNPADVDAYRSRGLQLLLCGNQEQAINDFDRVIELARANAYGWWLRGLAREITGDLDRALADFGEALRLDPQDYFASYNRGGVYLAKHEFHSAVSDFTQTILNSSDPERPEDERVLVIVRVGAYCGRAKAYAGLRKPDMSISDFDKALQIKPDAAEAYLGRANVRLEMGANELALEDLKLASDLEEDRSCFDAVPNAASLLHASGISVRLEAMNTRGQVWLKAGDYERAVEEFSRAIEMDSSHGEVWGNRGIARLRLGLIDAAIQDFSRAIQLDAELAEAYVYRGVAYTENGELDRASKDFNEALRLRPAWPEALNGRGLLHLKKGECDLAIADFEKALTAKPAWAEGWNNLGNALLEEGEKGRAFESYCKAITADSNYALAYYNRANLHAGEKRLAEAVADYDRAIQLSPELWQPYHNRGVLFVKLQNFDAAISDFCQASSLAPEHARTYVERGHVYRLQGRLEEARRDYQTALSLADECKFDAAFKAELVRLMDDMPGQRDTASM
jgi:tetratricopeptide (TPR) repeat protein